MRLPLRRSVSSFDQPAHPDGDAITRARASDDRPQTLTADQLSQVPHETEEEKERRHRLLPKASRTPTAKSLTTGFLKHEPLGKGHHRHLHHTVDVTLKPLFHRGSYFVQRAFSTLGYRHRRAASPSLKALTTRAMEAPSPPPDADMPCHILRVCDVEPKIIWKIFWELDKRALLQFTHTCQKIRQECRKCYPKSTGDLMEMPFPSSHGNSKDMDQKNVYLAACQCRTIQDHDLWMPHLFCRRCDEYHEHRTLTYSEVCDKRLHQMMCCGPNKAFQVCEHLAISRNDRKAMLLNNHDSLLAPELYNRGELPNPERETFQAPHGTRLIPLPCSERIALSRNVAENQCCLAIGSGSGPSRFFRSIALLELDHLKEPAFKDEEELQTALLNLEMDVCPHMCLGRRENENFCGARRSTKTAATIFYSKTCTKCGASWRTARRGCQQSIGEYNRMASTRPRDKSGRPRSLPLIYGPMAKPRGHLADVVYVYIEKKCMRNGPLENADCGLFWLL